MGMNPRPCLALLLCTFACGPDHDPAVWQPSRPATSETDGGPSSTSSDETSETGEPAGTSTSSADATGDASTSTTSTIPVDPSTTSESSESSGDSTTGEIAACGDGVIQPGEECDDPGDLHCFDCIRDRLVFVTSKGFQGDWAVSGVDYWCNHLAAQAGLITDNQPRFKPWASTSLGSPTDRLEHSRGRYVMVNDLVFANSWDDIVAGNLLNTLNVDENSQTRDYPVWTGTAPDGTAVDPDTVDCAGWTDDGLRNHGHYGFSFEIGPDWTLFQDKPNPLVCVAEGSLYCFESP